MRYLCGLMLILMAGCASVSQTLTSQTQHPDGTVEIRSTKCRTIAVWDARQTVDKLRASNGKTQSVGLTGADGEATSTNLVAGLEALAKIIQGLR